jgi:RNA recognition motif-containing protein
MTRLYVGNLSFNTTEAGLADAFAACGGVSEVKIVLDRETGRSRGFAFVTMSNDEGARAAMSRLDGHMLDGRALRVNEANEREPRGGGNSRPRW